MQKTALLVLFGGKSSEYEVSLSSAHSILTNIDREKYDVITVGITKNGDWFYTEAEAGDIKNGSWCADTSRLARAVLSPSPSDSALLLFDNNGSVRRIHIDVIFPVMHGANAEDGTLQGLLTLSGIPFVGCGCAASAVGMDKGLTKLILSNYGIPQAKCTQVSAAELAADANAVIANIERLSPYPLFVKPANAGSSVGASKAANRAELASALSEAAKHDSKLLVEEFISGKEIEVAVIGNKSFRASTCGQINTGNVFYDYDTKYSADSTATYSIPADILAETSEKIREYAVVICTALGVRGLSRVDFFVRRTERGEDIIFNEINTLPGFTSISMYPKLLMHDGMSYSQIIDSLISLAMEGAE